MSSENMARYYHIHFNQQSPLSMAADTWSSGLLPTHSNDQQPYKHITSFVDKAPDKESNWKRRPSNKNNGQEWHNVHIEHEHYNTTSEARPTNVPLTTMTTVNNMNNIQHGSGHKQHHLRYRNRCHHPLLLYALDTGGGFRGFDCPGCTQTHFLNDDLLLNKRIVPLSSSSSSSLLSWTTFNIKRCLWTHAPPPRSSSPSPSRSSCWHHYYRMMINISIVMMLTIIIMISSTFTTTITRSNRAAIAGLMVAATSAKFVGTTMTTTTSYPSSQSLSSDDNLFVDAIMNSGDGGGHDQARTFDDNVQLNNANNNNNNKHISSSSINSNPSTKSTTGLDLTNNNHNNHNHHQVHNNYRQQRRQLKHRDQLSNITNPYVFEEHVCGSIDIRNSVAQFKHLENCTILEGHLRIVLIDNGTPKDFENITFPMLREITDYFLLFRVMGLKSLTKMFPNLSVIRGRALLHNYAFVIYEMLDLQEIGLQSLTTIVRGDIRIQKNPNLCFVDTIDWSRIARNFLISDNNDQNVCQNCAENCQIVSARRSDGKSIGDSYNRLCWTPDICQKQSCLSECEALNQTCSITGECCPEQCLGGCAPDPLNPSSRICFSCKNFVYQNRCYDVCPSDSYAYYNRRCLTESQCHELSSSKYKFKAFMKECDYKCPVGYTEDPNDERKCITCGDNCPKICASTQISNVASAQMLKGCTIINGSLEIYINNQGNQMVKELEESLKDLVEIMGYLKIARSFPLVTLNFLRNLKVIHGNTLERDDYSLLILDNPNLQDLWTFHENEFMVNGEKRIKILNGRIFVHINPKLCYAKIKNIVDYMDIPQLQWDERDVSTHSNGDRVPCNVSKLNAQIFDYTSELLMIAFENFKLRMDDPRLLLGYLIYYREAQHQNVTFFDGIDACSNNEWTVIEYDDKLKESDKVTQIFHLITNLKPYTQYALYIKTYTIDRATKGAQSDIIYFKTKPDTPSQPLNLFAKAKKYHEVWVKWDPPSKPNGEVTHYKVRAIKDELRIVNRDYCSESITKDHAVKPLVIQNEPILNHWHMSNNTNHHNNSMLDPSKQCCSCNPNDDNNAPPVSSTTASGAVKLRSANPNDVEQSINFEDYLINTVYVKRTVISGNSSDDESRRRRHINHEFDNYTNQLIDIESTTIINIPTDHYQDEYVDEISNDGTNTAINGSNVVDVDEQKDKWQFNKTVFQQLDVLITDLEHYTEYTIEVKACQNDSNLCSVTAITSVKTLPLAGADDIDEQSITYSIDNSTNNHQYKNVHIKWKEPSNPNGFILSYQIEYKRVTQEPHKSSMAPTCIARDHYEKNNYGYTLEYLASGNYSVRLRARSLANYGNWTQPFYIIIEEPANSKLIFVIIAIIILFLLVIIPILYYKIKINQDKLQMDYMSVNPDYISHNFNFDPKWEIPKEKIKLIRELGEGSFGKVYEGEFEKDKTVTRCAVKTLNENTSARDRLNFIKEAEIMKSFNCHHIVKLLGICSKGQAFFVLMEIMTNGDLRNYLRRNRPDNYENGEPQPPTLIQKYKMAIEIADGMAYLASKRVVHRDLAARNCMLADDLTVKIGDFGMTRDLCQQDYYRKGDKGFLPVRWMSPEALEDGLFTTYSDVWAYGVVLWEMVTFASQPYQGLSNEEVLKHVVAGNHMNRPDKCPDYLWTLMSMCWSKKPKARPTFIKLIKMLLDQIQDQKSFLEVSYYNASRSENDDVDEDIAKRLPQTLAISNKAIKDEATIPLRDPEFHSLNGDDEDSDNDASDYSSSLEDLEQLNKEDINVQFFPNNILEMSDKDNANTNIKQNDIKANNKSPKPNIPHSAGATSFLKGIISSSLHASKHSTSSPPASRIHDEKQQNGNLDESPESCDNIQIDILSPKSANQLPANKAPTQTTSNIKTQRTSSSTATKSDDKSNRNLINGRLIDSSMV